MSLNTIIGNEYEEILINAVRVLPPSRVEQLVDFARFLEAQILIEELSHNEDDTIVEVDNVRWDALLATDVSQNMLDQMAAEALTEYRAEQTKPMEFDGEERIVPG
jgi:hypothetical protein